MKLVFKVGTSTLCHAGGTGLNFRNVDALARALCDIKNAGNRVILVTSGAIGAGVARLNLSERPRELRAKQAVAAVGQCALMHIYDKAFSEYGATVAQILLTADDTNSPTARANLLGTFEALQSLGVIPIVNENDSVAFEEIESEHHIFGDNDTLSAIVAALVGADRLVLLSDIDGLFDRDPRIDANAALIRRVAAVTPEIEKLAGGAGSTAGTGGMVTKLRAAKIAAVAGIEMVITNGANIENLYAAAGDSPNGTLFGGRI